MKETTERGGGLSRRAGTGSLTAALRVAGCVLVLSLAASAAWAQLCQSDADCDDGLFCTRDVCRPSDLHADERGCVYVRPGFIFDSCTDTDGPSQPCYCQEIPGGWRCGDGSPECYLCTSHAQCDDGLFCNGSEICAPRVAGADAQGCYPGNTPCSGSCTCDEATDTCTGGTCGGTDVDGDGHDSQAAGGDDCDDFDMDRYPGNTEVCDSYHDEDCDPLTFGERDDDGDGYFSAACCNDTASHGLICGNDCDDSVAGINPAVPEVCNDVDDNCNGVVNENVGQLYYWDGDRDNWGVAGVSHRRCSAVPGVAQATSDCNDSLPGVHPGAVEVCNGVDDNCNGVIDEGFPEACL